jgi:hypothetical protein
MLRISEAHIKRNRVEAGRTGWNRSGVQEKFYNSYFEKPGESSFGVNKIDIF